MKLTIILPFQLFLLFKQMRNSLSLIHLFLLLISIPSSQTLYKFSELQQNEIFEKINYFGEWFSNAYSKISEKYRGRQKAVTFEDVDFRNDMTLPRQSEIKHISEKLRQYFDALNYGELKKESGAREMLEELSEELDKFRVKMSDWLEAELREKWRQSDVHLKRKMKEEKAAMANTEMESSSAADGNVKDEKRKGKEILEHAESSSSRNIENEEKIGVHFLSVKINEKIYDLNEQIWFQNYNPFLRKLKREMQTDQINIWKFYLLTLETRLNGIMEKELNKKILGIVPKMWKRDAEKIFNTKIGGIVQKVRNKIGRKSFNEMKKGMEAFLKLDETVMGTKIYEKKKFIKEFFEKLLEWQKGYCKIVNKIKLAELEEIVAEQMDENVEMMARENAEIMKNMDKNVPKVKNIAMDADGSKSTALGRMAKFARNVVNEIETEIGKKFENEAIKMEIKHLYYTVLTNRATMEMVNFMENEFVWNENVASQRNKSATHQQSPQHFVPLTEHSEIIEEEMQTVEIGRKKIAAENLAKITILVEFFLKNYLDKLNDKIKMWKLVFDFDKRKENMQIFEERQKNMQIFGQKKAKLPKKEYKIVEEDNPLVQSIKSLWQSTKNKNGLNLFEYGMRQNELPENFLDRHKTAQQGIHLDIRIIVDSMNLLAIFSRLKHLMEKTGMDKNVYHFKAGKIGLEIKEKLKVKIENIHGQRIPRTFAAFIYDKYVENFEPKPIRGGFVPPVRRSPTKRPPSSPSSTETETEFLTPPASPFNPSETGQHGRGDHQNEEEDENGVEFQNDHRENDHQIPESLKAHWDLNLILEGADFDQQKPESSNKIEPFSDTFVQPADVSPPK